ncbi:MAG: DUF6607 family protein [Planctomycetota bacterium]
MTSRASLAILWIRRLTGLTAALTLAFTATAAFGCPECSCDASTKTSCEASAASAAAPEADRQAILKMAGEYHVTFQFQETVAVQPGYALRDPYHSEATEFVEVIEDRGDFISLQHVLVLQGDEGEEPRVVKHWRQDWKYEDTDLLVFRGNRTWEHVEVDADDARGTWSQAVYQVDDSPRYESYGKWTHTGDRSAWESEETWRPLPRREYTKRSDYQVLVARNRHTITPQGWVHEQDNRKLVLNAEGQPETVIAHESGLNVYDHTDEIDFTAGRLYWEQTAAYWQDVRDIWAQTFDENSTVALRGKVDGERLHTALFGLANDVRNSGHSDETRLAAHQTVSAFLIASE